MEEYKNNTVDKIKQSSSKKKETLAILKKQVEEIIASTKERMELEHQQKLIKEKEEFEKKINTETSLVDIANAIKASKKHDPEEETEDQFEEETPKEISPEEKERKSILNEMEWKPPVYEYGVAAAFCDENKIITIKKVVKPDFDPYRISKKRKKGRENIWRKCLALLDTVKYDRTNHEDCASECCFPTTKRSLINLLGNSMEIKSAVDNLVNMGIIGHFRDDYVFTTDKSGPTWEATKCPDLFENKARRFLLYYSNEVLFRNFCKENNLNPWTEEESGFKNIEKILSELNNMNPDEIRKTNLSQYVINQKVKIKWDGKGTRRQFEEQVVRNLLINNPDLRQLVKDTKEFNSLTKDPLLKQTVEPHLTWDKKRKYIRKIGLRATCPLASIPKHYDHNKTYTHGLPYKDRLHALTSLGLTKSDNDVKSSVPRIGHFLHTGEWLSQSEDCYKIIFDIANSNNKLLNPFHKEIWSEEVRDAMKTIFMSVNFSESWKKANATTDWKLISSNFTGSDNDWLLKKRYFYYFDKAVTTFTGKKAKSSSVFLTESSIYMKAALNLAKHGHKVFLCYDGFYTDNELSSSDFEKLIHDSATSYMSENPYRFSSIPSDLTSSTSLSGHNPSNDLESGDIKNNKRRSEELTVVKRNSDKRCNKLLQGVTLAHKAVRLLTGCYNDGKKKLDRPQEEKQQGRYSQYIVDLAREALEGE